MKLLAKICWVAIGIALAATQARAQDPETYEMPPINYSHAKPDDAVTHLRKQLDSGALKLQGSDREVVQTLLKTLHLPLTSQLLVFSKTSFQKDRISPDHPRALYYNDNCYLGWVPGGLVELAAIDPRMGPVFYSYDPRDASLRKTFRRDNDCLQCHGGQFIPGIPGVFARTVFASATGEPFFRQGTEIVDYRTPFNERWGGWYVTGTHGKALHRGNVFASEDGDKLVFNAAAGANVTNLSKFFDASPYLTNTSAIVSLLVFEHQTAMQNALTRAAISCRQMLDYQKRLEHDLNEPSKGDEPHYDSVRIVLDHSADDIVDTMLFKDEADLPDGISIPADFQKNFAAGAPRDKQGDSLKDLLFCDHVFKNRCSYMIYSDIFLKLPQPLKRRIYARLAKALDLKHPDSRYCYIHDSERKRIVDILRATHPEFRKEVLHE